MTLSNKQRVLGDGFGPLRPKPSRTAAQLAARFLVATALASLLLASETRAVTIDTVLVGNAGNAPDQYSPSNNPDHLQFGAVPYDYRIGTTEVTVGQYTEFLNAVAKRDRYGLYSTSMATSGDTAGIARSIVAGSVTYSVIGSPNKPVTFVSWGDAARFVNWLSNGQPNGEEGPGTTETGAYTLNGAMTGAALNAVVRNPGATWSLPSENEWYKAAYYDPTLNGGLGGYWQYPTRSNTAPYAAPPPGTSAPDPTNVANYWNGGWVVGPNHLTDAGAYASTSSFYGTYDQAGNIREWNETVFSYPEAGPQRGVRGGSYNDNSAVMAAAVRPNGISPGVDSETGFRVVAAVPVVPGDVNFDGIANGQDIALIASQWLQQGTPRGDANFDGIVNGQDFALVASNWLDTDPSLANGAAAVPEPSTIVIASLAMIGLSALRIRRRSWASLLLIWSAEGAIILSGGTARADIFEWEYINPLDPSQGVKQSNTLVPGGTGVSPAPGAALTSLNLTKAYLIEADLTGANAKAATLTNADFRGANLAGASLQNALVTGTNFSGAVVTGANFSGTGSRGFTPQQLYSTASYQDHQLQGINLQSVNLNSGIFSDQNLTGAILWSTQFAGADFSGANLAGADFQNANIAGADFSGAAIAGGAFSSAYLTKGQVYSTESYQAHDLRGTNLSYTNFSGWDLRGQDFTGATLTGATFTGADLTGAVVSRVSFSNAVGLTKEQLYSTASYQAGDLRDISLRSDDVSGWNFAGQDLTRGSFRFGTVSGADFSGAVVKGALFESAVGLTKEQLYSTASYQAHDLRGVSLNSLDMSGWNFSGQNLSGALLEITTFTGANFSGANLANVLMDNATLKNANMTGANLTGTTFTWSTFSGTKLNGANLAKASFYGANLNGANLTGANVADASFWMSTGLSKNQLYSTTSYQTHDLHGISLSGLNLGGWDFSGQSLAGASLISTTLSGANFAGATINGALFNSATGFTKEQLYSTASYQGHDLHDVSLASINVSGWDFSETVINGASFASTGLTAQQLYSTASYQAHDLHGVGLAGNSLSGWDFSGQIMSGANFGSATLAGTNFAGAVVAGANFSSTVANGFTPQQLYATASYQVHDLHGVGLAGNNLSGWNFSGVNLAKSSFSSSILTGTDFSGTAIGGGTFASATLTGANFSGADIRGANFYDTTSRGFTKEQLYSTASYQDHDLGSITLRNDDLSGWDLSGQNLDGANFWTARLNGTNFAGAVITNATFYSNTWNGNVDNGFTSQQFYSTASYQAHDLHGIKLWSNNLSGWDLHGQNLTGADFDSSNLNGTNLSGADTRGALNLTAYGPIIHNTILPDGSIGPLKLAAGEELVVRNNSIGIGVEGAATMAAGATLSMVLDADVWQSTMSFAPGISVTRDGTLLLGFADEIDVASQIGQSWHLFDWSGAVPTGTFAIASPYVWNITDLYTTGEVTLAAFANFRPDTNGDGIVNGQDIANVAAQWLQTGAGLSGDANGDDIVNGQDIALMASTWLQSFGGGNMGGGSGLGDGNATAVPEPSTLVLTAMGFLCVFASLKRQRRY